MAREAAGGAPVSAAAAVAAAAQQERPSTAPPSGQRVALLCGGRGYDEAGGAGGDAGGGNAPVLAALASPLSAASPAFVPLAQQAQAQARLAAALGTPQRLPVQVPSLGPRRPASSMQHCP